MGYQNGTRPKKKKLLLSDLACDLSDLRYDLVRYFNNDAKLVIKPEDIINNLDFMEKTLRKYIKKVDNG